MEQAHWERGRNVYGYWQGSTRLGWVGIPPARARPMIYKWGLDSDPPRLKRSPIITLRLAKQAVERALSIQKEPPVKFKNGEYPTGREELLEAIKHASKELEARGRQATHIVMPLAMAVEVQKWSHGDDKRSADLEELFGKPACSYPILAGKRFMVLSADVVDFECNKSS